MTGRKVARVGWCLVSVGAVALIAVYVFSLLQRPSLELALVPAVLLAIGFVLVLVARVIHERRREGTDSESEAPDRSRLLTAVAALTALVGGGVLVLSLVRSDSTPGWVLLLVLGALGLVGGLVALIAQIRRRVAR